MPRRVAVLDTETTGLPRDGKARTIEVGGVILEPNGYPAGTFHRYILPHVWSDKAENAQRVHGITYETLMREGLRPEEAMDDLQNWLLLNDVECVTSYNVAFDREMLERDNFDYVWGECVMEQATRVLGPTGVLEPANANHKHYRPDCPWLYPSLRRAAELCNLPVVQTHRALDDALIAAAVHVSLRWTRP